METKKNFSTIDEYIAAQDKEKQKPLQEIRKLIIKCAPKATEKISYGMPAFDLNGILVWFAANKAHYGLYPHPSAIEVFKERLQDFKTSKGAIQFPADEPLPKKLIADIVKFRIMENQQKTLLAKKKK